jgi:hypothetical protein
VLFGAERHGGKKVVTINIPFRGWGKKKRDLAGIKSTSLTV